MKRERDIFYSLPEVWDFCLDKIYDKEEYVKGFIELFEKLGIQKDDLILDAGCGSGFPAIDLIQRGYRVTGTDKSSEMVRQIKLNAEELGVSIEAKNIMWSDLAKNFDPVFDLVYCRGNSLVYAASWEQNWIVPHRSQEEILKAIQNIYAVLKPGGYYYVDKTSHKERPRTENLGVIETKEGPIEIIWKFEHDEKNRIRTWTTALRFVESEEERIHVSYSYLLTNEELEQMLKQAGFSEVKSCVSVRGEGHYDVFIARK